MKSGENEDEDENTNVGIKSIKQTISALEWWRVNNAHLYKGVPEAQVGLRLDPRIKKMESAAAHSEPERIRKSQMLKATGTSLGIL